MTPDTPTSRNFFDIPKKELPPEVWAYPSVHAQLEKEIEEKKRPNRIQIDFIINCVRYAFRQKLTMNKPYLAVMLRQLSLSGDLSEEDLKLKERLEKIEPIKQFADQLGLEEMTNIPAQVTPPSETKEQVQPRKPKAEEELLKSMQDAIQGKGDFVEPNFGMAVMRAIQALQAYPESPIVILSAAVCYQARGYKSADLPIEQRMQDMEHAIDLLGRFLGLTATDKSEKVLEQRKKAGTRQLEIRKKLADMREKFGEKPEK